MAPSKKKTVEALAAVKNVGPSYAEKFYDELGVRSVDELIEAAKSNELQEVSGIGAKREETILDSALAHRAEPEPEKESDEKKKAAKPKKKAAPTPEETQKSEAKKAAKKKTTEKTSSKTNGQQKERPKAKAWTSGESRKKSKPPSIPGLLFKLGKKLIGRLLR